MGSIFIRGYFPVLLGPVLIGAFVKIFAAVSGSISRKAFVAWCSVQKSGSLKHSMIAGTAAFAPGPKARKAASDATRVVAFEDASRGMMAGTHTSGCEWISPSALSAGGRRDLFVCGTATTRR